MGSDETTTGVLDDAVKCRQGLVRGRDLICVAPATILTELPPADREARLARARSLAVFAGMNRVIFEDNGRVWRTLVLNAPGLPAAAAAGNDGALPSGAPSGKASTPPPATDAPPPSGAVDDVPN